VAAVVTQRRGARVNQLTQRVHLALPAAVTSVTGAIAQMQATAAATPPGDGLACFNRMYLLVTQEANSRLGQGFFADSGHHGSAPLSGCSPHTTRSTRLHHDGGSQRPCRQSGPRTHRARIAA
jgi:hypothetical protein